MVDGQGRQTAHATSVADGSFTLQPPRAGSYVLITAADRHRPAASTVPARHGRKVVQDIRLTAARTPAPPARRQCHRHDVRLR